MSRFVVTFLTLCVFAAAQTTDDGGVSVTVSRTAILQAGEGVFEITATAGLTSTQDQVLKALESVGISESNLTGVSTGQTYIYLPGNDQPVYLTYQFRLAVPAARFREVLEKLDALRKQPPEGITNLSINAYLTPGDSAVSAEFLRILPDLLAEARTRAQALAREAGGTLGAVRAVADSNTALGGSIYNGTRVTILLNVRFALVGAGNAGVQ